MLPSTYQLPLLVDATIQSGRIYLHTWAQTDKDKYWDLFQYILDNFYVFILPELEMSQQIKEISRIDQWLTTDEDEVNLVETLDMASKVSVDDSGWRWVTGAFMINLTSSTLTTTDEDEVDQREEVGGAEKHDVDDEGGRTHWWNSK